MNEDFLKTINSAHFIGIGGVGVSAVARLFLSRGTAVSGSDKEPSFLVKKLENEGARVFIGHDAKQVPEKCNLVVYSPAVRVDNPELLIAQEKGIQTLSYPEALGMISRGMRTIAISGTHGKTTTTAMIAEVLIGAHKNPTVIVGSMLNSGTNFVLGTSDFFVVEACEYQRSFLNLSPEILVITNIDNDHLDYYGDIQGVQKGFTEMVEKIPASGAIVCDPNDPLLGPVLAHASARIVDYTKESLDTELSVPGNHNKLNAKAALAVANLLEVERNEALNFLSKFSGTYRRMEKKGALENGALVYDDYAHHPTEIRATLQGLREKYPTARIRVVFQPHLYSRTKLLLNGFANSFTDADEIIVSDIYAAREEQIPGISADILVWEISKYSQGARKIEDFPSIEKYLKDTVAPNDIIITMGAGDIYKVGEALLA